MSFMDVLRQILSEGDPNFRDTHKHRCGYTPRGEEPRAEVGGCGLVFEHDRPKNAGPGVYEKEHKCPSCGRINYWRYHGRVPVGQKRLKVEAT